MRNMMQSMGMGMPGFGGGLFDDFISDQSRSNNHIPTSYPFSPMLPHDIMSPMSLMMMNPFQPMTMSLPNNNNLSNNGGFSYCSSTVTSYTTDEHGRSQVYQRSNEVKQGPGGLKETREAIRDSRTGHQELAIGHHLRDKARIKKRSKNAYTGEEEQVEDLVNLNESEADTFERSWVQQARNQLGCVDGIGPARNNRLALTNGSTSRGDVESRHYLTAASKLFKKDKKKKKSKVEKHN